ncbi:MAG: hypothetical protein H5U04_01430 [Firmicutes bacterium]|nr:hypothetical protein [Bacillota bacterium]
MSVIDTGGSSEDGILGRSGRRAVLSLGREVVGLQDGEAPGGGANLRLLGQQVVDMLKAGYQVVVTHDIRGDGGMADRLRGRSARDGGAAFGMWLAGVQGIAGYRLQQAIHNQMALAKLTRPVVTVVTLLAVRTVEDSGRARPRITAEPLRVVNSRMMRLLAEGGVVVVAAGGGGVPVVPRADGTLQNVAEMVDHDLVAECLASSVGANLLVILTNTPGVRPGHGAPKDGFIRRMSVQEAVCYLEEGAFSARGSRQKVLSCIRFIEGGGEAAVITQWSRLSETLAGRAGTWIVPEGCAKRAIVNQELGGACDE